MLNTGQYDLFCARLLDLYYDPKYKHKLQEYSGKMIHVDAEDLGETVLQLETLAKQVNDQWQKERGMFV